MVARQQDSETSLCRVEVLKVLLRLLSCLWLLAPNNTLDKPQEALWEPPVVLVACLAAIIHHEARGEPLKGQYAVAHVALNRASKNDTDVCKELKKPFQFSFYKGKVPIASEAARKIARSLLVVDYYGYRIDHTFGSEYFVRKDVAKSQQWLLAMRKTVTIGRHSFYKEK